jgi:hypothetical protein
VLEATPLLLTLLAALAAAVSLLPPPLFLQPRRAGELKTLAAALASARGPMENGRGAQCAGSWKGR